MEVFFEKNVVNNSIDKHTKRTAILKACRVASIVLIVVAIYFVLSFMTVPIESGALAVVFMVLLSLFIIALPIVGTIVFSKILNKLNLEYDYIISGSVLKIVKVLNRTKRKKILQLPLDAIVTVGIYGSNSYSRHITNRKTKQIDATCNKDSFSAYFFVNRDGDHQIIRLEMDDNFAFTLRKALNFTVFDDDFKKYLKLVMEAISKQ